MLSTQDIENIKSGNCVLLLGAGATIGSSRFKGDSRPILSASALAEKIAGRLKLPFSNEHLREVYDAAIENMGGKKWVHELLVSEYTDIRPSNAISNLFNYPWYRLYTLNIDDSLQNTPRASRVQVVKFVNGVNTDRTEWAGRMSCQVVHLHGLASEIDSGVVFSDEEYGVVYERRLGWYQQLREDFRTRNVYIIGSQLDEPFILSLIKREVAALKDAKSATLIVPNEISAIRRASLARANIKHNKGTLEAFVDSVRKMLGTSYSPTNIVAEEANIPALLTDRFSRDDVPALQSLVLVNSTFIDGMARRPPNLLRKDRARFLEGYGPNWGIVADPAYSELSQYRELDRKIQPALMKERLIVVKGEAGSGKSTYIYKFAADCARKGTIQVFQYRETSASFFSAMAALRRFVGEAHALVIVDDFRVYAEDVADFLSDNYDARISFLVDIRSSEWVGYLQRSFAPGTFVVEFDRFREADVNGIVDMIETKHVAPLFNAFSREERVKALKKSNRQLLFAIKEASQSKEFDETVVDEVKGVSNSFARAILLLVSFATLARTGLKLDVAASILDEMTSMTGDFDRDLSFGEGLSLLPGMVDESTSGTLRVRHDAYASIVINKMASGKDIRSIIDGVLSYFSQYSVPIITNISKLEGQLFKYTLNNKNIYGLFDRKQTPDRVLGIYTDMEQRLQLDGHFWLQYGLLLRRYGRHEEALERFERSIQAYDNDFSRHARAHQQLIIAATATSDKFVEARHLIKLAEVYLTERHYNHAVVGRGLDDGDYPISVLGHYHIDALVNIEEYEEAQKKAKIYFNWIVELEKRSARVSLPDLKERLMRMGVNAHWDRNSYRVGYTEFHS